MNGKRSVAFALAVLASSCGSHSASSSSSAAPASVAANAQPPLSFVEKIPSAPSNVAYRGTRELLVRYRIAGVVEQLEYREDVVSDGQGHFAIDPGTVTSPPMSSQAFELFQLLQKSREAFFYHYRDFRIRDLALFAQNYSALDTGVHPTIAGRACVELEIRRRADLADASSSFYSAAVDPLTGLVLSCEEISNTGETIASMRFTDFALEPDLANVHLHEDLPNAPLDLQSDTVAQIGFQVAVPRVLPAGYQLAKAERMNDGQQVWARFVFSDGVEDLFFLHSFQPAPPTQAGTAPVHANTISTVHFGPWTIAHGFIGSQRLFAMGKMGEDGLLQMIQSAL